MKIFSWLLAFIVLLLPLDAQTETELTILPPSVELYGLQARQQLLTQATTGDVQEDWTTKVTWFSKNPEI